MKTRCPTNTSVIISHSGGAQEAGHDERHSHDVHGDEAGHANQGRNTHHQPGSGIKPHFQPFGQRVGAGPPDVRAGKNTEQDNSR